MSMKTIKLEKATIKELAKNPTAWISIKEMAKQERVTKMTIINRIKKGLYEAREFHGITLVALKDDLINE